MVRSLGRTALAVVALLGMGAGVARAQENRLADAPMHLGPLYVTPTLELVQFGIDNNVFNENGSPASDYTFRGGPRVVVELPLSRLRVTASSTIDYLYFHRFTNLRGFNLDLDTRAELRLRRVTLFFEDSFRNTTDRANLEIDARARQMQNSTEAGLNVQLFPKLAIEIAARASYVEFAQDDLVTTALARTLNRTTDAMSASVHYALSPLTTLSLTGETRREHFESSGNRDSESWSATTKMAFQPRALISGDAAVGYRKLQGQELSLPAFAGLIADVGLSSTLFGSTVLGVTARRNLEHSFEPFEPYYVADGFGVSIVRRLTRMFDVRMQAERVHHRYRRFQSGTAAGGPSGRVDTVRNYSGGVVRRIGQSIEVGLDLAYWSRRSNQRADVGYEGLQAGLTSTYAF